MLELGQVPHGIDANSGRVTVAVESVSREAARLAGRWRPAVRVAVERIGERGRDLDEGVAEFRHLGHDRRPGTEPRLHQACVAPDRLDHQPGVDRGRRKGGPGRRVARQEPVDEVRPYCELADDGLTDALAEHRRDDRVDHEVRDRAVEGMADGSRCDEVGAAGEHRTGQQVDPLGDGGADAAVEHGECSGVERACDLERSTKRMASSGASGRVAGSGQPEDPRRVAGCAEQAVDRGSALGGVDGQGGGVVGVGRPDHQDDGADVGQIVCEPVGRRAADRCQRLLIAWVKDRNDDVGRVEASHLLAKRGREGAVGHRVTVPPLPRGPSRSPCGRSRGTLIIPGRAPCAHGATGEGRFRRAGRGPPGPGDPRDGPGLDRLLLA